MYVMLALLPSIVLSFTVLRFDSNTKIAKITRLILTKRSSVPGRFGDRRP